MLWHLQIDPAGGRADRAGRQVEHDARELGLPGPWSVRASRGFLVEGGLSAADLERAAVAVLVDTVVETHAIRKASAPPPAARGPSSTSCPSPA